MGLVLPLPAPVAPEPVAPLPVPVLPEFRFRREPLPVAPLPVSVAPAPEVVPWSAAPFSSCAVPVAEEPVLLRLRRPFVFFDVSSVVTPEPEVLEPVPDAVDPECVPLLFVEPLPDVPV